MNVQDDQIDYDAERVCRPRFSDYEPLSILAVDINEEIIWSEFTNEVHGYDEARALICTEPNSIIVGWEVSLFIKELHEFFKDNPAWQARVTPIERELQPWSGHDRKHDLKVNHGLAWSFIGFRDGPKRKAWSRRHYPIDPALFTATYKAEYRTHDRSLISVISWAKDLRRFLYENDLAVRATQTGIAVQLLTDKRFYPKARRKVPAATNATARRALPGNHYVHRADSKILYNAVEVDQNTCHHTIASELRFPSANSLYAKGYYHDLTDKPFAKPGSELYEGLIDQPGLFYLKLDVPHTVQHYAGDFPLPFLEGNYGEKITAFVYSNELEDLIATGVTVEYIIAAWTSRDDDEGLNRLAKWSMAELDLATGDRKRWLKPLLLSCYGLLAAKPRKIRAGYIRGKGPIVHYHVGRGQTMRFHDYESRGAFESKFANVIHRGMIESECRKRSLQMARWLAAYGFQVLTIYADAVFIAGNPQLPMLPPGWSAKAVTNAQFPNAQQIVCDQFEKLPGMQGKRRLLYVHELKGKVRQD